MRVIAKELSLLQHINFLANIIESGSAYEEKSTAERGALLEICFSQAV